MSRFRWVTALLLVFALLAAACGDDDDGSAGTVGDDTDDTDDSDDDDSGDGDTDDPGYDPAGVLRVATTLDRFDLELDDSDHFGTVTHHGIAHHIWGTPLQLALDGSIEPYLAESFEVVDAQTITLKLREGLTFQDGQPYDAATLSAAMLLHRDTEGTAFRGSALPQLESIDVDSDTELTLHLSAPVATSMLSSLTGAPAMVMSPGSTPDAMFGAGPYQIVEFTIDDKLVVEKWDGFFDADSYLLAGIEWLHIPTIEAAQNALEGGQVDLVATNPRDVEAAVSRGPFASAITNNEGHYMAAVCQAAPPFDDPEFRRAFDLAINREQINQVVFGGNAEPMESLWNPGSPLAIPGLIDTDGDRDEARAILDEIGYDTDTEIVFGIYPGFQTHELIAETIAGQVAEVGINLNITVMEGFIYGDFVNDETGGLLIIANINPGIQKVTFPATGIPVPWNPCLYEDPELSAMTAQITGGALTPDAEADVWEDIQNFVLDRNLYFVTTTQPSVYVYDADRVQGVQVGTVGLTGATAPSPFLAGVSIKAGS